jgi:hypothetical protein
MDKSAARRRVYARAFINAVQGNAAMKKARGG